MINTVTLIKQFCAYNFTERNCEKAVSLLARNILWAGIPNQKDICSSQEAFQFIEEEIRKFPSPYHVNYLKEHFFSQGEAYGTAFLHIQLISREGCQDIQITATSVLENHEEKIENMYFSVLDTKGSNIKLDKEKEALVMSTMSGGLMGGYCGEGFPFYFVNDRMLEYLGYNNEEEFVEDIEGLISNIMHPDDREMVNDITMEQLAAKGSYEVDYRMRKKDGSYIWVHDIGKLGEDENGREVIVSVCYDITSTKTVMQEIANIYNNIPGAVFSCRFNKEWTVISANDGLFRFIGYTREEFAAMGNKMSAVIYPDDLKIMFDKISSQLENGNTTIENENRLICKDGTVKWLSIKAQLLSDEHGEQYFYCVFVDISKQKLDEERSVATKKNLSVAISHLGLYYWEIEDFKTGRISSSKRLQRHFGISEVCENFPERFLSKGFVAPEDCERFREGVHKIYEGKPYSQFDVRIKTLLTNYVWMRIRISRIKDINDKHPRAVCTAEKIAEYKDLELRVNAVMKQNKISSWMYDIKRDMLQLNSSGYWIEEIEISRKELHPEEMLKVAKIHPDDAQSWLDFHKKVAEGIRQCEVLIRTKNPVDKEYHYQNCNYTLLMDREGVPTYALGISTDITEQIIQEQKYEIALKNRYKTLGENVVMVGHCSITQDKVLDIEDYTGLNLLERFGENRAEFFRGFASLIPDQSQRRTFLETTLSDSLIRDFELGISQHTVVFMIFMDKCNHDACWMSLHIDTVKNMESKELMGFLTVTNITHIKKQEQMLETIARRNYDYVAHVNLREDSMTLYRYRESCEEEDASYLIGQTYCLSEAIWVSASRFVVPEEQEFYKEQSSIMFLKEKLKNNDSYEFTFHMIECNQRRTKRMRIALLDRFSDTAVMTRSDVTEVVVQQDQQKKQLSEALEIAESANRHKTEFLAAMSHDIRTPMNAIVGMCELALQNMEDSIQIQESLETIQTSSQILLSLINNILDMSRIESGKMVLHDRPFSLLNQINKTADSYRVLAQQRKQKFQLYTNIRHDKCIGDIARIHSAIDNILDNAIKYAPEGGTVIYRVTELPSEKADIGLFRFEISNNGVKIDEKEQNRIFEPFYRGENERLASVQGTGLGLSITKQIVELKGGTILVKNSSDETTFVVELPIHLSDQEVVSTQEKEKQGMRKQEKNFEGVHILLCEDHPVNQKVLTRILERVHVKVTLAANGKEGYEKFIESAAGTYQLIFMDIRMPVMDGYEATIAIRSSKHPEAKTIPIIALSANAFSEDVQKSMKCGMNAHIAKPVLPEKIYETIETFREKHKEILEEKKKILFVDDAEINIAVLTANLQGEFEVFIARNGEEALNTLEQNQDIVAVITDIMMPGMDGITLIEKIRENACYNHIAVVANTQYGGLQQEEELLKIGADDFLYKPTSPDVVRKRLKMALKNHEK